MALVFCVSEIGYLTAFSDAPPEEFSKSHCGRTGKCSGAGCPGTIRHRICVPQRQLGVGRNEYSYRSRLPRCNRTRGGLDTQIKSYGLSGRHHPNRSMHFTRIN
jgi:hypothetical protein